jgi:hypothetical protein
MERRRRTGMCAADSLLPVAELGNGSMQPGTSSIYSLFSIQEFIMKNALITWIAAISVGVALSACATPGSSQKIVLPLDHGPRAQTTPWANQQRLHQIEAERAASHGK